jgi:hypothetical protein
MGTVILTGRCAEVKIGGKAQSVFGISEFSIELSRDINEQELLGAEGNEFYEGPLSIEGSYRCCKFAASGNSEALDSIISGTIVAISGQVSGSSYVSWYFPSCQVTSYDVTGGDASTISEANIDFIVLNPKDAEYDAGEVSC